MAYVIAEPCIGTKDTACVDVCPVDCIHPRKDEPDFESETQLYIHPTECIDCGACVPVCPVTAIFALEDLPDRKSTRLNSSHLVISYAVFCLKKKYIDEILYLLCVTRVS